MENEIIKLIWRPKRVRNRNQFGHDVGSRASANFGWKKKKKKEEGGKSPTRNLFPTCQDDSARAVGAHPDDYVDVVGPAWCREKKSPMEPDGC